MKCLYYSVTLVLLLAGLCLVTACAPGKKETHEFWDEIQRFKQVDKQSPPADSMILFAGSSTFRKWTDLEQVFKPYNALNRGFGGATLADLIYYSPEVFFKYKPRQIVIYCGDNDIATDTYPPKWCLIVFIHSIV